MVGANGEASNAGAAYVFTRSGTTWGESAILKGSNTEAGDQFGGSVDLAGDTVVVGATEEKSNSGSDPADNSLDSAGAAYVFAPPRRVIVISQ